MKRMNIDMKCIHLLPQCFGHFFSHAILQQKIFFISNDPFNNDQELNIHTTGNTGNINSVLSDLINTNGKRLNIYSFVINATEITVKNLTSVVYLLYSEIKNKETEIILC
jgi:hypothetical protein